jgi:precorrin-6B methylase 2
LGLVDLIWALIILGAAFAIFVLWSEAIGAGWQPTPRSTVRRMLEMSGTVPSDVVYDLGSGDGRIVLEAARTYHAKAVGVEADPLRVLISRLAVALLHLKGQVRVVWGNFFDINLGEATVVTLFLSQGANKKLQSKMKAELRPGARVVSYVWTFDEWKPASTDIENNLTLYVIN